MTNRNLTSRSPILQMLRKAFHLSVTASKQNTPPAELLEQHQQQLIERRCFIRDIAQAGLAASITGFAASCTKTNDNIPPKSNAPSIVIVGAGIAGLNCSYQLKKAGYVSSLYEGALRTGGRIFTGHNIVAQGVNTELGGEFIDSGHRDMLDLCNEFNLDLIDLKSRSENMLVGDSYYFSNQFYSTKEVIEAFIPFAPRIEADINALPDKITFDNYGNADKYDSMSISAYFDSIGLSGWLREALEVAYLTEYGRETDDQSSINFLYLFSPDTSDGNFDIFGISDERYKIDGGNQKLTDALYERVKDSVYFENTLTKIEETFDGNYNLYFHENGNTKKVKGQKNNHLNPCYEITSFLLEFD